MEGVPVICSPEPDRHTRLERIAARGWRGTEEEALGEWLLRAGHGFTGRANSALCLGDPGRPLDAAVDAVRRWYAERALPPAAQLPLPLTAQLDALLAARGWTVGNAADVLVTDLPDLLRRTDRAADDGRRVSVAARPDDEWLHGYRGARYRGAALPPHALEILVNAADLGFADVHCDGRAVGVARGAVDSGWLGITAVTVDPAYRRRGLAVSLVHALTRWAADRADRVYLQVAPDNAPAQAMYAALGFAFLHRYHYRVAPTHV